MEPLPPTSHVAPSQVLREIDARMTQALDNFFQRSRASLLDEILRELAQHMTPSAFATGQMCIDRLNSDPDELSTEFARQFIRLLNMATQPATPVAVAAGGLHLVDDDALELQLSENKLTADCSEALLAEMLPLFSRLASLHDSTGLDRSPHYAPQAIVQALSTALTELGFNKPETRLLLQCSRQALQDTLKHTYVAISQYLGEQGIAERIAERIVAQPRPAPERRHAEAALGESILSHIQSLAAQGPAISGHRLPPQTPAPLTGAPPIVRFSERVQQLQAELPGLLAAQPAAPPHTLRQLQNDARQSDAGDFDLAVLDTLANLFDFIFEDPRVSPRYQAILSHLQIPVFRSALASPEFFSDDGHGARRLIDLLGTFSRRFPEQSAQHPVALRQIETACHEVFSKPEPQAADFAQASDALAHWLADEDRRADEALASEISSLEQIERQELGTLLALETLQDLTARHPAPESVLRRLEAAWVPFMASLYVREAGEGPDWRGACTTMQQLFLSLQAPPDDTAREASLQAIPRINAALRHGLIEQGADSEQLKAFFSAITTVQECWVRPELGRQEAALSRFVPESLSAREIESMSRKFADQPSDDILLQQTEALLEGDWVDFDPPYEGLDTARVAWVGVRGYLLFCDSAGEQRFSLDCDRLADEIRAGRATIPEQSLTRKAMLRLKTQIETTA
jgi:hypothetical protein